jgi:DNA mismatch repair protein MutS2
MGCTFAARNKNMIYPSDFEQKTGFDKIRELIASQCLSPLGEEKVDAMHFSSDFDKVKTQLYRSNEFVQLLRQAEDFPTEGFCDVRDALKKIRIEGAYLTEKELFDMRRAMMAVQSIAKFFSPKSDSQTPTYPYLTALCENYLPASGSQRAAMIKQIDRILDPYGQLRDNASPVLADIRRQLIQTNNSISKILHSILRKAQSEGLIEKDAAPTMRDGRLVIPIAPALKRKINGIVHDESASGKTVFVEPAEVVAANNRVRELEGEERREIIRILTEISDLIRPEIPDILHSLQLLAEMDFVRAKALFAVHIDALLPALENRPVLDWIRAVHPLLALSHRKQNKSVVPLDIQLATPKVDTQAPERGTILIVSGPNAGGKSVLLKTVGLLQYMLQSGLLIPVGERSVTGIFEDIFIDIGDEQSIENDLSTYSSHLTNMKFMVKNASPKSLILIDEFGGGTEPQIGGAIAESLLHRFNEKGAFGVITTHYHNLKTFAETHVGVINGAMLYDRNKMQPLFQLSIGNAGSSFAIEIARKIGLPEDVIAEASSIVGQDYVNMDKYLQDIVRDRRYWESKRQKIHQQEKELETLKAEYQAKIDKGATQSKEIVAQAKEEAARLLAETNARIENTIREIKEAQAEKNKTKTIRKDLEQFSAKVKAPREKVKHPALPPSGAPLAVGDTVKIKGQQSVGVILELKGKSALVAFGDLKTKTQTDKLEKVQGHKAKRTVGQAAALHISPLNFNPQIDLRGMRGDEALQALMYYMDDAIQFNAGRVRILHGTGTGALRQIVRDYLSGLRGVRSFQDEHVQFGGVGITVVELE